MKRIKVSTCWHLKTFPILHSGFQFSLPYCISARGNFSGGGEEARSTKGWLVRGSPRGGFREAEPPGRRRSFQKICKKSNDKLQFLKKFNKQCDNFLRVWTKNTIYLKFWENFEICWRKVYRKIEIFCFIIIFWENLLLKMEPSEITPFFCNFFGFGRISPFPLATPLCITLEKNANTIFCLNVPLHWHLYWNRW